MMPWSATAHSVFCQLLRDCMGDVQGWGGFWDGDFWDGKRSQSILIAIKRCRECAGVIWIYNLGIWYCRSTVKGNSGNWQHKPQQFKYLLFQCSFAHRRNFIWFVVSLLSVWQRLEISNPLVYVNSGYWWVPSWRAESWFFSPEGWIMPFGACDHFDFSGRVLLGIS